MKPPLPAMVEVGSIAPMDGAGFGAIIVNDSAFEPPPPGAGLKTVTAAVPGFPTSLAGIAAERLVPLTNVVARFEPFQRTTELGTKPAPLTDRVKAASPALAELGEIEEI